MAKIFSRFGRQIFSLYETRPLFMNSLVGSTVYIAGEYIVQTQSTDVRFFHSDNWKKLAQVGTLGAAENGVLMLQWYGFLNRVVGSGVGTGLVLIKCLFDQIFFATQQDLMFLGLCAVNNTEHLELAWNEVKDTFLTTWIMDCSLWPLVNFAGFAFVPVVLQPTYMACVSFFWQLYLSNATSAKDELADGELQELFTELDEDGSGFIEPNELISFFKKHHIEVTQEEIEQMILDADYVGEGNLPVPNSLLDTAQQADIRRERELEKKEQQDAERLQVVEKRVERQQAAELDENTSKSRATATTPPTPLTPLETTSAGNTTTLHTKKKEEEPKQNSGASVFSSLLPPFPLLQPVPSYRPEQGDGKVSFEEFKILARKGEELGLKSSTLWRSLRREVDLVKGTKQAIKRVEQVKNKMKEIKESKNQAMIQAASTRNIADSALITMPKGNGKGNAETVSTVEAMRKEVSEEIQQKIEEGEKSIAALGEKVAVVLGLSKEGGGDEEKVEVPCNLDRKHGEIMTQADWDEDRRRQAQLKLDRDDALRKAGLGGTTLLAAAVFRKLVLKI